MKRISGGQLSREAKPRFYQVTPAVLGRRRATQALPVRPGRVDALVTGQPAASPRIYRSGRTSPPRQPSTLTVTVVPSPGRTRLDLRGSSSDADCLRRRSPAAVRANGQGRAYVVRRRCRVARTSQPRQRTAPGRRPRSLSRVPRVRPGAPLLACTRSDADETRKPEAGCSRHSDSRDRPTKQQRGAVAVATTAAGPDRRTARTPVRGKRGAASARSATANRRCTASTCTYAGDAQVTAEKTNQPAPAMTVDMMRFARYRRWC